ncbi:NUDIX hydrolase [Guggenheimella bovis]
MYTTLRISIEETTLLKPRESVLVIAMSEREEFFLNSFIAREKLCVEFPIENVGPTETPTQTALRILHDYALECESLKPFGKLYPKVSNVECIHLFLARNAKLVGNRALILADLELLLKYMEIGVFCSEEGKEALVKLMR